jgi:5-methyltetrahydrofolate--homocysteine methyltransferase
LIDAKIYDLCIILPTMEIEGETLVNAIVAIDENATIQAIDAMISANVNTVQIIKYCSKAMDILGQQFQSKEIFLAELIMAGELLKNIMAKLGFSEKSQQNNDNNNLGTIVLGTVQGDIHDIGKNIVKSFLQSANFRVIDLGVDVAPEKFIDAINTYNAPIVALSGLLTLVYDSMKKTIEAINQAGLRDQVKIMIGGGQIDQTICDYAQADGYGVDAITAQTLARKWMGVE